MGQLVLDDLSYAFSTGRRPSLFIKEYIHLSISNKPPK